jgi:hypothetical protein
MPVSDTTPLNWNITRQLQAAYHTVHQWRGVDLRDEGNEGEGPSWQKVNSPLRTSHVTYCIAVLINVMDLKPVSRAHGTWACVYRINMATVRNKATFDSHCWSTQLSPVLLTFHF